MKKRSVKTGKLGENVKKMENGQKSLSDGRFGFLRCLGILIRAPEVPFLVPPKWLKLPHFGGSGGYQKWHFGCPNQNFETTFRYKLAPKIPKKPP